MLSFPPPYHFWYNKVTAIEGERSEIKCCEKNIFNQKGGKINKEKIKSEKKIPSKQSTERKKKFVEN